MGLVALLVVAPAVGASTSLAALLYAASSGVAREDGAVARDVSRPAYWKVGSVAPLSQETGE